MRTAILLLALVLALPMTACSSTDERPREFTQGARIDQHIDDVWVATRSVIQGFGRGEKEFNAPAHEARAVIGGELVTVRLEEHSGSRTVIHVITKDAQIAQDVLSAIQSMLPQ